jgi:hypothetical protein
MRLVDFDGDISERGRDRLPGMIQVMDLTLLIDGKTNTA